MKFELEEYHREITKDRGCLKEITEVSSRRQNYQTQWATQFYVAAELTRRGYLVSLTLGNAPVADLLVVSPNKVHFAVEVKGQASKNFWLIKNHTPIERPLFVLVYLPKQNECPKFYIMTSCEIIEEREKYKQHIKSKSGRYRDDLGGMNWATVLKHENRWDKLPK